MGRLNNPFIGKEDKMFQKVRTLYESHYKKMGR